MPSALETLMGTPLIGLTNGHRLHAKLSRGNEKSPLSGASSMVLGFWKYLVFTLHSFTHSLVTPSLYLGSLHLAGRRQDVVRRFYTHVGLPAVTGIVGVMLHVSRAGFDES